MPDETDADYGYVPDHDFDEDLGIPTELSQRAMLTNAVVQADMLATELHGAVPGMLADYVRHALAEASSAAAALLTMHPNSSERELFELQKRAAPYAYVLAWIREELLKGKQADEQLEDLNERQERHDNGEAANRD